MKGQLNGGNGVVYFVLIGFLVASICAVAVSDAGVGATGVDALLLTTRAPNTDALSDLWTLQGRIYAGEVGDERHPLQGVTVSVYGANDPYPVSGTFITSTTTDATGWYGLAVSDGYEYYHLLETDPWGFSSAGATSVDGSIKTSNWIEFEAPLAGKTLTGNKFWDQPLYILSGRVYQGAVGNESAPLSGGTVTLYGSNNEGDLGTVIDSTTTNAEGWYGLMVSSLREFYTIVESDPAGYTSAGATSVDGMVVTSNRIRYAYPLAGKTLTGNKFWDLPPATMPDLVVTDVWTEERAICYQLRNVGDAVAPEGHHTALVVDDEHIVNDLVTTALAPGARRNGCFDYEWECSPPGDSLAVAADTGNSVPERNETNNLREEFWRCDTTPPRIISGPAVVTITPTSAVVVWETDEESDHVILYDVTAGRFSQVASTDLPQDMEHAVTLINLQPSTTYQFKIRSEDASGNFVISNDFTFETAPMPDGIAPGIALHDPGTSEGMLTCSADAGDNTGVRKVEFYLNDKLFFTDFSPPYTATIDTRKLENGEYLLTAKAQDFSKRSSADHRTVNIANLKDTSYPVVTITSPTTGETVSGNPINVTASISDDLGLMSVNFFVYSGNTPVDSDAVVFTYPWPNGTTVHFDWNTYHLTDGTYRLLVQAWDNHSQSTTAQVEVVLNNVKPPTPPKYPELKVVGQSVTRNENQFSISLAVKNIGNDEATNISILHTLRGFQPIERHYVSEDYLAHYEPGSTWGGYCQVKPNHSIQPGHTRIYTYKAVPVMIHPKPAGWTPQIGHYIDLSYDSPNQSGYNKYMQLPVATTGNGESLSAAYRNATNASDFLIVTNAQRLFSLFGTQKEEVNELLSTMALLAYDEHGVLGYLNWQIPLLSGYELRKLILQNGTWSKQMNPKFNSVLGGYVLIVGEVEIIPSWTIWSVHFSDQPYAGKQAPELIVSRIIGNNPSNMSTAIRSSIGVKEGWSGYTFDRSHALLVSGTDASNPDKQNKYVHNVNDMADILSNKGVNVTKIHWKDIQYADRDLVFRILARDKDVICYRDHGLPDYWDSLCTCDVAGDPAKNITAVDFNVTKPFALALACWAGNYEDHPEKYGGNDDYNIAEAFFDRGAAVYIGSTQISSTKRNNVAGKTLFKTWDASESIGYAFTAMERSFWSSHAGWCRMYNLYGDPTFGATASASLAASSIKEKVGEPKASLDIVVPDYEVNNINGTDYVEIPGGDLLLQEDWPEVPIYTISIDYPSGYEVQDVMLTNRSGLIKDSGLDLPIYHIEWDYLLRNTSYTASNSEEWYPGEVYNWHSLANRDDSISLVITLYPFYYNSLTTDIRFYKNYSFNITYTISNVSINSLTTDKNEYPQEDMVMVDLGLSNSGEPQDVVISAMVKRYGSDELVDGLLLSTLTNLTGPASYSLQWNSSSFEPGDYLVEVILCDTAGTVLDSETELFRLGISSGDITSFTATPEHFEVGDAIAINMTFANTGTVNLTGTAIVRVTDGAGCMIEECRHNVTDLQPSGSISFRDTWDTTGAAGLYNILGYVLYESRSTDPVSVMIGTETAGFDTGSGIYPSVAGTHTGTITPNQTILVRRLYTYPCRGTGGHAEYVKIWRGMETLVDAEWAGYNGDWQNITFDEPVVLEANETYYYTITTGSYPQIIHASSYNAIGGVIACTSFVDINGKQHEGWIPAILLS
ncbi:MAG: Ig-like domain-containing protein [Candidatus Methanospirareceae archaeon]